MDWPAFDRALKARRRLILRRFVECLRVGAEPAGRVLETGGNPVVLGERLTPGASRTLLI